MSSEVVPKTPLEAVEQAILDGQEMGVQSPVLLAATVLAALRSNGYVIARSRFQWRH